MVMDLLRKQVPVLKCPSVRLYGFMVDWYNDFMLRGYC